MHVSKENNGGSNTAFPLFFLEIFPVAPRPLQFFSCMQVTKIPITPQTALISVHIQSVIFYTKSACEQGTYLLLIGTLNNNDFVSALLPAFENKGGFREMKKFC